MIYTSIFLLVLPFVGALPSDPTSSAPLLNIGSLNLTAVSTNCETACSALEQNFGQGSSCLSNTQCLCSNQTGSAVTSCFTCLVNQSGSSLVASAAKPVLGEWANVCNNAGMPVSTPNLSAAVSSGSAAASGSGSAVPSAISGSASGSKSSTPTSLGASASSSASGKPSSADAPLREYSQSAFKAAVGALLAVCFI